MKGQKYNGITYTERMVTNSLGIPSVFRPAKKDPVPQAGPGELVLYYGGWNLQELKYCRSGMRFFNPTQHCGEDWEAGHGYYRIRLPTPYVQLPDLVTQRAEFPEGWELIPARILLTAELVHLARKGKGILESVHVDAHFYLCKECFSSPEEDEMPGIDNGHVCISCNSNLHTTHLDDSDINDCAEIGIWVSVGKKC